MIKLNIFGQNDMRLWIEGGIGDLSYSLKYGLKNKVGDVRFKHSTSLFLALDRNEY